MIHYLDFGNITIHEYFCILNIIGFSWTHVKNIKVNKHTIMATLISFCPKCQEEKEKKAKSETPTMPDILLSFWLIKK